MPKAPPDAANYGLFIIACPIIVCIGTVMMVFRYQQQAIDQLLSKHPWIIIPVLLVSLFLVMYIMWAFYVRNDNSNSERRTANGKQHTTNGKR